MARRLLREPGLSNAVRHAFPRIQLTVPDDWQDESVITFAAPSRGGAAANIVITEERPEGTWQAAVERSLRELRRTMRGYRLASQGPLEHGGAPAIRVEHGFRSPDNVAVHQIQLFVWRAPRLVTLTVSQAEAEFERDRPMLERILAEVEVE